MKGICALVLLATVCCVVQGRPEDLYTTKYDNFDVDAVLNNRRLLINYMQCILDQGKCTKEGAEVKRYLPDALKNGCSKCSEKQKDIGKKVLKHIYEKEKEWYDKLEKKYDPTGNYRKRYAEDARKEGINIQ